MEFSKLLNTATMINSTDRNTELAILEVVREKFPDHLILGEEGGVSGDSNSDYLWCIDPLGMFVLATHSNFT